MHWRPANVPGILGVTLVVLGFFLPYRFEISAGTPISPPGSVLIDSFWQMLVNTIRGGSTALYFPLPLESLIIGVFLLSLLLPLGAFLAVLVGKPKRTLLFFSLILALFGFLEFLLYSAILLLAFPGITLSRTPGPGFWLMLIGFPISIGSSIVQVLFPRYCATVIESPIDLRERASRE